MFFCSSIEIRAIENDTNANNKQETDNGDDKDSGAIEYTSDDKRLVEIKDDLTFDPVQKRWVRVKDMVGVQKNDIKTVDDGDGRLYENAMVYDKDSKKWSRENIDNHLYDEINVGKEEYCFWKNFSIGISIGGGATFYRNSLNGLAILDCKDKLYFQSAKQKAMGSATHVGWFHDEYELNELLDGDAVKMLSDINDKDNFYTGRGWSFPIALFFDYKFFDLLRVGFLFAIEATMLSSLVPNDEIKEKVKTIDNIAGTRTLLWNVRPLLFLGCKVYAMEDSDFFVNVCVGPVFDKGIGKKEINGSYSKDLFAFSYTRSGIFVSVGPSWENKLNGYCTMISQLSYDFKYYKDDSKPNGRVIFDDKSAYVSLWQHSIKMEVGMRFTFAEN